MHVELPVVTGEDSPRRAFEAMKVAGRSGVIIRMGAVHAMAQASVVAAAAHQNVNQLKQAAGLILVPEDEPCLVEPPRQAGHFLLHPRMVIPGLRRATISVGNHWKPLLESGPALCFCDANGHPGSPEGSACQEPGCPGVVVCLKY